MTDSESNRIKRLKHAVKVAAYFAAGLNCLGMPRQRPHNPLPADPIEREKERRRRAVACVQRWRLEHRKLPAGRTAT